MHLRSGGLLLRVCVSKHRAREHFVNMQFTILSSSLFHTYDYFFLSHQLSPSDVSPLGDVLLLTMGRVDHQSEYILWSTGYAIAQRTHN